MSATQKQAERRRSILNADERVPGLTPWARIFNETNPNWEAQPEYNQIFIKAVQNYLNDKLKARGHVFLNEVYDQLGFKRTSIGQLVGWLPDDNKPGIVFNIILHDGSIVIDFNIEGSIYKKI